MAERSRDLHCYGRARRAGVLLRRTEIERTNVIVLLGGVTHRQNGAVLIYCKVDQDEALA